MVSHLPKSIESILAQTVPKLSARERTRILTRLPKTKGDAKGLIVTALSLSLRNQLVPLRQTTDAFLANARTSSEYNLYLQSLSHIPFRTPETTRTVQTILAHVDQLEDIRISTRTYTRLIRPGFTPVALLEHLHQRLSEKCPQLPVPILLSFLAAYSKLDDPAKSELFFAEIRTHPQVTAQTLRYASTLLLSAQHSQKAAYDVLTQPCSRSDSTPYNTSASLHVLSKDLSIPAQKLIQSFLRLSASLPNPPVLPLYTSLINGLILRKRYDTACVFFSKLIKRQQPDIPSLAAGINALTRAGKPHQAFQVLESYYPSLLSPISPSSLPLLTFLTALNRISRPDLTTLLFFLYPNLYPSSPPPNPHLLNILLQAGRTGLKMDIHLAKSANSIPQNLKRLLRYLTRTQPSNSSLLTKLNLRTSTLIQHVASSLGRNLDLQHLIAKPLPPFGRQRQHETDDSHPHPRLAASNAILSHLGHPSRGGLRRFVSSAAYQGLPSGTWARLAFLRVVAGASTQAHPLWQINPPVVSYTLASLPELSLSSNPLEPKPKLDSFTHLFSPSQTHGLVPYPPMRYFKNPKLWENLSSPGTNSSQRREPFYPSIIPTNSNFFNYILLLALSDSDFERTMRPIKLFPDARVRVADTNENSPAQSQDEEEIPTLPAPSTLEIPLTLAWMRTLNIQPSKSTLAVTLILWGEVCARVDAHPLVGSSREERKVGEQSYLDFVGWLKSWVGEERLPHWRTLEKWRRVLRDVRGRHGWDGEEGEGSRRAD